jgi:hypothetical protein
MREASRGPSGRGISRGRRVLATRGWRFGTWFRTALGYALSRRPDTNIFLAICHFTLSGSLTSSRNRLLKLPIPPSQFGSSATLSLYVFSARVHTPSVSRRSSVSRLGSSRPENSSLASRAISVGRWSMATTRISGPSSLEPSGRGLIGAVGCVKELYSEYIGIGFPSLFGYTELAPIKQLANHVRRTTRRRWCAAGARASPASRT